MKRLSLSVAACTLAVTMLANPLNIGAARAQAETTVNLALLDMSAMATGTRGPGFGGVGPGFGGMGPGPGFGGMGPGMMGPGGFGAIMPGMMGPGGFGMMTPGMTGPGGFGMMMGMMSIRADKSSVPAGTVTFNVTNWSQSIVHEVVVVAVDNPNAPLPYDYAKQVVPEDQVKMLGETEELAPNGSGSLELTLPPGNYLLICNIPGHYAAGMVLPFTVSG